VHEPSSHEELRRGDASKAQRAPYLSCSQILLPIAGDRALEHAWSMPGAHRGASAELDLKRREIPMRLARTLGILLAIGLTTTLAHATYYGPQKSLYQRLGGKPAITAVVNDFVTNVAKDNRINKFFANTDIPRLKRLLVQQICAGSGGPCQYEGRSMREAHRGLGVRNQDFNALVEDLVRSLDKFNVPPREQKELLGLLGPMRRDVVQPRSVSSN
jgi:hemoglobin